MGRNHSSTLLDHTAVPALAGYVYQLQQAVLRLMDLREGESLGIEVLDDFHVQRGNIPYELNQAKFHGSHKYASLSNTSAELWKTLGIWAGAVADGSLDLRGIEHLVLITRARIPKGSIAEAICTCNSGNGVDEVIARITDLPRPKNMATRAYHEAVCSLEMETLREFVRRIAIHADRPGLAGVTAELKTRLRTQGFHASKLDDAVQRLYGWIWDILASKMDASHLARLIIPETDFYAAHCRIRDDLTQLTLPVRYVLAPVPETELGDHGKKMYVQQLKLVGAAEPVRLRSVSAFFRATAERTEWTERGEILPEELNRYDQELFERWEMEFQDMCQEVGNCADNVELKRRGLSHFQTIEKIELPIRPGWVHKYLTMGSYHILSDCVRVGWHPHFKGLVAAVVQSQQVSEERA